MRNSLYCKTPECICLGGIYKGTGVVQDGNIITPGTRPYIARDTGRTDGTPELTKKLIDALAASQK